MKKSLLILIGLLFLFSGCDSSLSTFSITSFDLEYLNHTNNTIYYDGTIDITGNYLINGNPITAGTTNFSNVVVGIFSHMDNGTTVNLTNSGTQYKITNNFENDVIKGFIYDNSTWIYNNTESGYFQIDVSLNMFSDLNNNDITFYIKVNGVAQNFTGMGEYLKYANEYESISTLQVVELNQGDNITFELSSSLSNSIITLEYMLIKISPFASNNWKELPINSTFEYDSSNKLENITNTYSNFVEDITFTYDDNNRIQTATTSNPFSGDSIATYNYTDGLLVGVTYG